MLGNQWRPRQFGTDYAAGFSFFHVTCPSLVSTVFPLKPAAALFFPSSRVSAHVDVLAPAGRDEVDVLSTLWFRHSVATVKGPSKLAEGDPVVNRPFASSREPNGFHIRATYRRLVKGLDRNLLVVFGLCLSLSVRPPYFSHVQGLGADPTYRHWRAVSYSRSLRSRLHRVMSYRSWL